MSLGSNIKFLRESHHMSQIEFGKIADATDKAVSTWESGTRIPRMGAIEKIAKYFGLRKSDIIDGDLSNRKPASLSNLEQSLLADFRRLNLEGQKKVIAYANDLAGLPQYLVKNVSSAS